MARQIVVGIDIGTSEIKVVVAEGFPERGHVVPKIIGTGSAEAKGISRGFISSKPEAAKSIETAIRKAEKASGIKLKRAYVSFGGIGLGSLVSSGSVAISKADLEITERDLSLALEAAERAIPAVSLLNKRIINTVPVEWKMDGKPVWGEALGLKAAKIEAKALFITCLEHHLTDLIAAVEEAGIEVVDVVAAPIAASFVTVSKKQKRVGCVLADFGAETFSVVVFENNSPVSLEVLPIGGADITNDIALKLRIPLEDAEYIKRGDDIRASVSKKKLEEVVNARLAECFKQVESHLKTIDRHALLPAGIIIAGGASNTMGTKAAAENHLKLPAQLAEIHFGPSPETRIKDRAWAVACGLAIVGFNADNERRSMGVRNGSVLIESGRGWGKILYRWFSQFLP